MRAASANNVRVASTLRSKRRNFGHKKIQSSATRAAAYTHWSVQDVAGYYHREMKANPEVGDALKRHQIDGRSLQRLDKADFMTFLGISNLGVACAALDLRDNYRRGKRDPRGDFKRIQNWKISKGEFKTFFLEWLKEGKVKRSATLKHYDAYLDTAVDTDDNRYLMPDDDRHPEQSMKDLVDTIANMKKLSWIQVKDRPSVFVHTNLCISDINLVMETFSADGEIWLFWKDPNIFESGVGVRTVVAEGYEGDESKISFEFTSDERLPIDKDELFRNEVPQSLSVDEIESFFNNETKVVTVHYRFSVDVFEEMELHRFPYDRQFLQMQMLCNFEDWRFLDEPISDWKVPDRYAETTCMVYLAPRMHTQYELFTPLVDLKAKSVSGENTRSSVLFGIRVQRYQSYFATNMIFPLFLITSLSLSALLIPPSEISDRIATILTLLLTTVAFKFILASELPPMSYMTYIDKYLVFIYLWYCGLTAETIFVHGVQTEEDDSRAVFIDDVVFWACFALWMSLHTLLVILVYSEVDGGVDDGRKSQRACRCCCNFECHVLYKSWKEVKNENIQSLDHLRGKKAKKEMSFNIVSRNNTIHRPGSFYSTVVDFFTKKTPVHSRVDLSDKKADRGGSPTQSPSNRTSLAGQKMPLDHRDSKPRRIVAKVGVANTRLLSPLPERKSKTLDGAVLSPSNVNSGVTHGNGNDRNATKDVKLPGFVEDPHSPATTSSGGKNKGGEDTTHNTKTCRLPPIS